MSGLDEAEDWIDWTNSRLLYTWPTRRTLSLFAGFFFVVLLLSGVGWTGLPHLLPLAILTLIVQAVGVLIQPIGFVSVMASSFMAGRDDILFGPARHIITLAVRCRCHQRDTFWMGTIVAPISTNIPSWTNYKMK